MSVDAILGRCRRLEGRGQYGHADPILYGNLLLLATNQVALLTFQIRNVDEVTLWLEPLISILVWGLQHRFPLLEEVVGLINLGRLAVQGVVIYDLRRHCGPR